MHPSMSKSNMGMAQGPHLLCQDPQMLINSQHH
jgi:hypothetical protein